MDGCDRDTGRDGIATYRTAAKDGGDEDTKNENMLNLRYRGQFLAIDGTVWRVDILQEGYQGTVSELEFEADETLVIDWKETSKEEVICSSEATLRIESPGDRTYEDLYTIAPGEIRMDVFRKARGASEWQLYWSGLLDPEFYEEPYEWAMNYPVALTFSDFGILDRLKFEGLTGKTTVWTILGEALNRTHLNYTMDYVPGSIPGPTAIPTFSSLRFEDSQSTAPLDEISVVADNFYDEDGDPCTLKDAIAGVLQPLGLKLIQRAGKIWVFDLNGLHAEASPRAIRWDGNSQTMGADKVYNNIKVTWSPYVKDGNLGEEECFVTDTDRSLTCLNDVFGQATLTGKYWSYHCSTNLSDWTDPTDSGFTLWTSTEGKNATLENGDLRFFKIVSQQDGEDCQGVAIRWPGVNATSLGEYQQALYGPGWGYGGMHSSVGDVLWKTRAIDMLPVMASNSLRLHITLEMLMDCRFNPFEEANNYDAAEQKTWNEQWATRGNFVYVPVTIKFQPEGSDTIYCWDNQGAVRRSIENFPVTVPSTSMGSWSRCNDDDDANPSIRGYLAWYDANDRAEQTGVLGWKSNRPTINPHTGRLSTALSSLGDGQWLPMPPEADKGGKLWIEVRSGGWMIADGNASLEPNDSPDTHRLWKDYKTSWCLMKLPQVEVRKAQTYDNELDTDDVEYKAVINEHAREDLELQTICGTAEGGVAMARGAYWRGTTQIEQMTRAGRTATVEQLLIGTLYSQFATRHTTLEGEAAIDPGGLTTYTEQNQGAKRFMLLSERQDVRMGTADCLYCELSPDQYDRNEQQ